MSAREIKPIWTSSTFLVYAGGLTVLGGAIGALGYLSGQYPGHGQGTAWTLLILVILYAIAILLLVAGRPIAADHISQARWENHLRSAVFRVPVEYQPRGRPASAPSGCGFGPAKGFGT